MYYRSPHSFYGVVCRPRAGGHANLLCRTDRLMPEQSASFGGELVGASVHFLGSQSESLIDMNGGMDVMPEFYYFQRLDCSGCYNGKCLSEEEKWKLRS